MEYPSKKGPKNINRLINLLPLILVVIAALALGIRWLTGNTFSRLTGLEALEAADIPEWIDIDLIAVDGAARRGEALEDINDIVIHYIGNPATTAVQNRNYFNNPETTVSAHFIVGLDGEIVQCIPLDEKSSASNWRNSDTISIEVCHWDESGEFSPVTYASVVRLTSWLCDLVGFKEENIIRHYDITEKLCPLYYVENETAWAQLKSDIMNYKD